MKVKINKNPVLVAVAFVALALILIVCTVLFKRGDSDPKTSEPAPSSASEPAGDDTSGSSSSTPPSDIPDVNRNQSSPETPYDAVDWSGMSATTLTEDEILSDVKNILGGLLTLDAKAIERVSLRSTGGQHNPFRLMLDAATADDEIKAAFLNMGSASSYEVIGIDKASVNAYTISMAATTPYMGPQTTMLAATDQIVQLQEVTLFKASGAARAVSEMDMNSVPLSTDIVQLTIVIEDDVPVIYHPNSFAYGNNSPQYAFLWGGVDFQGTQNGDLMLINQLGAGTMASAEEPIDNAQCALIVDYLNSAMTLVQSADMDALHDLELAGDRLGTHWTLLRFYPEQQALFKKYGHLEAETMDRLKSFEYNINCYAHAEKETGAELYTISVTYSVEDALTGKRVYFSRYYNLNKSSKKTLSDSDGNFVNDFVDVIIEDALGGGLVMTSERLMLAGLWEE